MLRVLATLTLLCGSLSLASCDVMAHALVDAIFCDGHHHHHDPCHDNHHHHHYVEIRHHSRRCR